MIQECTLSSRVPGRWEGSEGAGHLGHALLHCGWGSTEPEAGGRSSAWRCSLLSSGARVLWVPVESSLSTGWKSTTPKERPLSQTVNIICKKWKNNLKETFFFIFPPKGRRGKTQQNCINPALRVPGIPHYSCFRLKIR